MKRPYARLITGLRLFAALVAAQGIFGILAIGTFSFTSVLFMVLPYVVAGLLVYAVAAILDLLVTIEDYTRIIALDYEYLPEAGKTPQESYQPGDDQDVEK